MAHEIMVDQWGRIGVPSAPVLPHPYATSVGYLPMNAWRAFPQAERYSHFPHAPSAAGVGWMAQQGRPTFMPAPVGVHGIALQGVELGGYYCPHPYPAGVHGLEVTGLPGAYFENGRNASALLRVQQDAYRDAIRRAY